MSWLGYSEGVKIAVQVYIDFLKEHIIPRHKNKKLTFRKNMVFVHDSAPVYAARLTTEYFSIPRNGKIMQWPACSPDLNLI